MHGAWHITRESMGVSLRTNNTSNASTKRKAFAILHDDVWEVAS